MERDEDAGLLDARPERVELGHPGRSTSAIAGYRRRPESGEQSVELPGGFQAPACQVAFVRAELERVRDALEVRIGQRLTDDRLRAGMRRANRVRALLRELRRLGYTADQIAAFRQKGVV